MNPHTDDISSLDPPAGVDADTSRHQDLGAHRVLEPVGSLPQEAWRLDATPIIGPGEILVDVASLHLDAASFTQISAVCDGDPQRIALHVQSIVADRGKMHNPVTGSGGILVGTVREIDPHTAQTRDLAPGDSVVSMTSLSWLPLCVQRVLAVYPARHELRVEGTAIIFAANPIAMLPADLPRAVALAALDVAGAAPRSASLARWGGSAAVIGAGGTAGLLTLVALRQALGPDGRLLAIEFGARGCQDIRTLGVADTIVRADATRTLEMLGRVEQALAADARWLRADGPAFDLVVNVVNVPRTEFATVLLAKPTGRVLFFSMATSFTTAALATEGLGNSVALEIGNGLTPDCGAVSLELLRRHRPLLAIFTRRFEDIPL